MKTQFVIFLLLLNLAFISESCKKDTISPQPLGQLDPELGIEEIPESLGRKYRNKFNRYTKLVTPNGGAIHIVAQNNITNEQMIRCRSILQHFLTDYEESTFGSNKDEIANKMAENGAILLLLNGEDDGSNKVLLKGQPLYQNEIQVEGQSWYTNQDYEHRDAAFEEILHLVHDYGIGVDGGDEFTGASSEFQSLIRNAQENALNNQLWGIGSEDWIKELRKENSLSQEYLASLIDSYYGLWGAWTESNSHGMWGIYIAKTREEILSEDPIGYDVLNNKFFHPYLTYNARIDSSFTGTFHLRYNDFAPYSNHSQYLKDISLLGSNNTDVQVNELDNNITGNNGINTVVFLGNYSDYTIENINNIVVVSDNTPDRDGSNTLSQIEKIKFNDQTINL